jgi:hypothetical protein
MFQMTDPLPLDTVLGEFSEDYKAWVIQSKENGQYLVIPDNRFPGRKPIRFFMSQMDASRVLEAVLRARPSLARYDLFPVEVRLYDALKGIAADSNPDHADCFVVHSPNEVFEFVRGLEPESRVN